MANGVRPIKKMSANQLTQALVEQNARLHMLSTAVGNDMQRVNVVLFTLLKELGFADEKTCDNCGTVNMRPILRGIEIDPHCVECGTRIDPMDDEIFTDPDIMDADDGEE